MTDCRGTWQRRVSAIPCWPRKCTGAILGVGVGCEFSHFLARAWATSLAREVRLPVCSTAEAPVTGDMDTQAGHLQRREQEKRSFCLILVFPFLFQASRSLNFNFQLVKIQNSPNLSAACKMHYANEGLYMQRYYVHTQSL